MMRRFLVICLSLVGVSFGQGLDNFETLKATGDVPKDFTEMTVDKYKVDLATNKNKELDKDFFLSSRYFIDELLLSGRLLFNDELTVYLNKVARYVLRSEKKLYDELRFYVLKSTVVNAFSTDQGIIIFTTGLLAQLENEAQLAYIIAHEVSHYTEEHVKEAYLEKRNLAKGQGKYERLDYESRISELSIYEKSKELEADSKGVEMYLKTEYAVDEIFSSFEMLLYSYLPFDEVKFDPDFVNTDILNIPDIFFPDTTKPVTKEEGYDDSGSSHPNIQKRMDTVFDQVENKSSRGNLKYKISESDFLRVRELARFEQLNLLLAERKYGEVLYNIFLLNRAHPDNRFLDLCFVKAWYGLVKYKNANRYREVVTKPKKIEGESFPLHLFLYDLSRDEINVIAYRHVHDMAEKYPTDKVFGMYRSDLKEELALRSKIDFEEFKMVGYEQYMSELTEKSLEFDVQDSITKIDNSDLSKYQKIRLKKKLNEIEANLNAPMESENNFYLFGLHDLVKDGLIDELNKIKKDAESENEEELDEDNSISRVVVVDPIYEDYNLKNNKNFKKSERKKITVSNSYTTAKRNLDLEVETIDSKNLDVNSVDKYNELGLVFQWLNEVVKHDEIDMISSMHDQMVSISLTYGTDHFLFTGIYAYKDRKEPTLNHLLYSFSIYGLPFVIADLLIIRNYFEIVSILINAHTDQVELVYGSEVNLKGTDKILDAYIYDMLYQVKSGGGK